MVFMFNSNKLNNTDSCVFMSSAKCQLFQGRDRTTIKAVWYATS